MNAPVVIGDATLYLGDCLDVLRALPAGSISAVVTDPPYGINYTTGFSPSCSWTGNPIEGDSDTALRDTVISWANDSGIPWACFGSCKAEQPNGVRGTLVWDKGPAFGMGDLSFPWKPSFELVFIGGPGWQGKREEGVLRGPCVISWESKGRVHPMQKPTWLVASLLKKLPGGITVLDPFMGSGTTGVACLQTGRKFIGCEIDERYFNIACKRLRECNGDGSLFADATPSAGLYSEES